LSQEAAVSPQIAVKKEQNSGYQLTVIGYQSKTNYHRVSVELHSCQLNYLILQYFSYFAHSSFRHVVSRNPVCN
jgi:hypothetical protein